MFCSQCAHELAPSDVYCPKCAKPIASFNFDPGQIPNVEYIGGEEETVVRSRPAKASRSPWYVAGTVVGIAALAIGLVVVAVIGMFIYLAPKSNALSAATPPPVTRQSDQLPDRSSAQSPTPLPTRENPRRQLIDSQVPVTAGKLQSFDFAVESPARITGGFVTYGGSNDIDAYIVDDVNYQALLNGYNFRYVFARFRSARSKIDVAVPAGRWYVVFSNRHSLLTGKIIAAEIYYQEQ